MKTIYISTVLLFLVSYNIYAQQVDAGKTIRTDGYYYTLDEMIVSSFNFYVFFESGKSLSFIIDDSTNVSTMPEKLIIYDTIITGIVSDSIPQDLFGSYIIEGDKIKLQERAKEVFYWEYSGLMIDGSLVINSYQLNDHPVQPKNIIYHFRPFIELTTRTFNNP